MEALCGCTPQRLLWKSTITPSSYEHADGSQCPFGPVDSLSDVNLRAENERLRGLLREVLEQWRVRYALRKALRENIESELERKP